MENSKENKFVLLGNIAWIYTKYQLLTKAVLLLIIFPIFRIVVKQLITSTGRVSISSGDYLSFLFSLQGVGLLIACMILLIILIGTDINAFIIMSALIKEKRLNLSVRQLLFVGIKSLKSFIRPSGILIIIYIALITPIVGVGLSLSVTRNLKIPNFITSVIFDNNIYFAAYCAVMILLIVLTLVHIFFFHYLIIDNQTISNSLKKSAGLMKKHWLKFIKEFFIKSWLFYIIVFFLLISSSFFIYTYAQNIESVFFRRLWSIFMAMSIAELSAYLGVMTVPFICYKLTNLFYKFNEEDGYVIRLKMDIRADKFTRKAPDKLRLKTKLLLLSFFAAVLAINGVLSIFMSVFFDEVFMPNSKIDIVAHRGGGDLAAENSILGMEKAAAQGAKWSEIDVQRTKDGYYIINHDSSFARLTGIDKTSEELNLEEIRQLKIKDLFNSDGILQPVSTLEEFLDAAKGKIGLFIELKGATADEKMVDDVVRMLKAKKMENEVAILSLDYKLISYTEKKYPEFNTGYLYFFSIGEISNIKADMLIMEEEEATDDRVDAIHQSGKKAIVWTVNTDESIRKFISSDIDGIITDHVKTVKDAIKERNQKNDIEIIIESIMEF